MKATPAFVGGALAAASVPLHLLVSGNVSTDLAAVTLATVAAIYVGFALADGRPAIMGLEAGVALLFAMAALAGLTLSRWATIGAFALHGLWDYAHHRGIRTAMPRWYIPFCAVFDWVFALGLGSIWLSRGATQ